MQIQDIVILLFVIVGVLVVGLFFLSRWATKKAAEREELISKHKQSISIFVIDKQHERPEKVKLPKVVLDALPVVYKKMKMYFVLGKVGPQVVTLICDKTAFNYLLPKKTYNVEVAGIQIVSVKGMKTPAEQKMAARAKIAREKELKKQEKLSAKSKRGVATK
ncbi:MAG: hypothetical protein LBM16_01330 [Clostridiales bacterium]|nr:hypothetical protein [Clostridiales bacterium]